jgi:hypothetical protein
MHSNYYRFLYVFPQVLYLSYFGLVIKRPQAYVYLKLVQTERLTTISK